MRRILGSAVVMVLFLGAGVATYGQDSQRSIQASPPIPHTRPGPPSGAIPAADNDSGISPAMQAQQTKFRSKDRQKQLLRDTDELLQLATELKAEVNKTNENVLSIDVMRKADEIEKLAKSVKNQMKN